LDFGGRVAVVTGAGKGMGREYALMLATRGARVVVNDIVQADADRTVEAIGGQAVADYSDVARDAPKLIEAAVGAFGQVDIVVNNAAIIRAGLFWQQDPDEWWRVFEVSLRGTVEVCRAAWPHLMQSGSGRIINVASSGMLANKGLSAYGSAKGAIWALGNILATEGAEVGVRVMTVMPTAWTPMTEAFQQDPDVVETMRERLPAEHVAAFVTFLAHQDTAVDRDIFNIGGDRAFRMVLAALPAVGPQETTPEGWAAVAAELRRDSDNLTPYRDTFSLFANKLIAANPALAESFEKKRPADLGV
jgi:NAD(P)-dependent dehydrogenase (short-subunit alcohol dehydrogenase family)